MELVRGEGLAGVDAEEVGGVVDIEEGDVEVAAVDEFFEEFVGFPPGENVGRAVGHDIS